MVFSFLLKDGSELAEVTTGGRLFHTRAAATRMPGRRSTVRSLVRGRPTIGLWRARSQSLECFRLISPVQVVGEIQRCRVMSATVNLNGQSKLDAFRDPQPVQVSKQMCDMVVVPCFVNKARCSIQHGLKAFHQVHECPPRSRRRSRVVSWLA